MPLTLHEISTNHIFNDKHKKALDQFFDKCCELYVVFGEVNIAGIMYTKERKGYPEFVLVDGIGKKLLIPFRAMNKTINTHNVRKIEADIKSQIDFYKNENIAT